MGIRAFSHPAGINWAKADWCLDRILAAGEGPIPGDWEDQGERSPVGRQGPGPGTCCSLALPPVPGIGTYSARRQYLKEEGTHIAAWARGFGALGTRWERRLGPVRGLARFHCADRWQHVRGSGSSREGCQMAPPEEEQGFWALRIWRGCVPAAPCGWQGR